MKIDTNEKNQLLNLAQILQIHKIKFFNTSDGIKLRTSLKDQNILHSECKFCALYSDKHNKMK